MPLITKRGGLDEEKERRLPQAHDALQRKDLGSCAKRGRIAYDITLALESLKDACNHPFGNAVARISSVCLVLRYGPDATGLPLSCSVLTACRMQDAPGRHWPSASHDKECFEQIEDKRSNSGR